MARFDIDASTVAAERRHTPCLLDMQHGVIAGLAKRVVVPLRRESAFGPRPHHLNPHLTVRSDAVVRDTAAIGTVQTSELRNAAGDLREARLEIQEALDTLFGAW